MWETGRVKKVGMDEKAEKKTTCHFFVELLLEHVTLNETEAFDIPPNKGNKSQCFVYTLFW